MERRDERVATFLTRQKEALRNEIKKEFLKNGENIQLNSIKIDSETEIQHDILKRLVTGD